MGAGASVDALSLDGELKELLSYYDGNLESAADAVNREIVRVVPKTGSGRFVPERGEQTAVQGVVDRATKLARHGYAVAWEGYKAADGDERHDRTRSHSAERERFDSGTNTPEPWHSVVSGPSQGSDTVLRRAIFCTLSRPRARRSVGRR